MEILVSLVLSNVKVNSPRFLIKYHVMKPYRLMVQVNIKFSLFQLFICFFQGDQTKKMRWAGHVARMRMKVLFQTPGNTLPYA